MLRPFEESELAPVRLQAGAARPELAAQAWRSLFRRARALPSIQDQEFHRGVSTRFLPGPVAWATDDFDLSMLCVSPEILDRTLLLPSASSGVGNRLRRAGYRVRRLDQLTSSDAGDSVNLFWTPFAGLDDEVGELLAGFASGPVRQVRVFVQGLDARAQAIVARFLGEASTTGICWHDPNNTIETTLPPERLLPLVERMATAVTPAERATAGFKRIPDAAALRCVVREIEDGLARCSDPPGLLGALKDSRRKRPLLKLEAKDALEQLREEFELVDYFCRKRIVVRPEQTLLELLRYLNSAPLERPGNRTVRLAREQGFSSMRPHVWSEPPVYEAFYRRLGTLQGVEVPEPGTVDFEMPIGGVQFAHDARHLYNAAVIEYAFGILSRQFEGPIRWLDIGCGRGIAAHLASPERVGVTEYEIRGVDHGERQIAIARSITSTKREFVRGDAFEELSRMRRERFHLVTMFEFLEHLEDPVAVLRSASRLSLGMVFAGSPLDERIGSRQTKAHLWSFSQHGFESLFRAAGLRVVLSNAMKIGRYEANHDWVSCMGTRSRRLSDTRETSPLASAYVDLRRDVRGLLEH